jgi:hypothetical protein
MYDNQLLLAPLAASLLELISFPPLLTFWLFSLFFLIVLYDPRPIRLLRLPVLLVLVALATTTDKLILD